MRINPCPCVSLQMGVKIVSTLDGVLALLKIFRICVGSIKTFGIQSNDEDGDEKDVTVSEFEAGKIMITVVMLSVYVAMMILAVKLFRHAQAENYTGCRKWLIVTIPLVTILSCMYIAMFVLNPLSTLVIGNVLLSMVFKLLEIVLVYLFTKQFSQQYHMGMGKKPSIKHDLPC